MEYNPWRSMESAPLDGTWIEGQDEAGRTAVIQSRRLHPKIDLQKWFVGEPERQGNWEVNRCFYPIRWRERRS